MAVPRLLTTEPNAIIAVTTWLLSLRERGRSSPVAGRGALRAAADALTIDIPATARAIKLAKQAPRFALHALLTFERIASDAPAAFALRNSDAGVTVMVFIFQIRRYCKHSRNGKWRNTPVGRRFSSGEKNASSL